MVACRLQPYNVGQLSITGEQTFCIKGQRINISGPTVFALTTWVCYYKPKATAFISWGCRNKEPRGQGGRWWGMSCLKQQTCIPSQFLKATGLCSLRRLKGRILPCLVQLVVAPGLLWLVARSRCSNPCLSLAIGFSSVSVPFSVSWKDTCHWMQSW